MTKFDIKYLGKDFVGLRDNLITFAKTYFPNTYNDFSEASPGMMFIEMAAFVGDVLTYYIDSSIKETMLPYAEQRKNVIAGAIPLGYVPKASVPAITLIDVYQTVPSVGSGDSVRPDYTYGLEIADGMEVSAKSDSTIKFRATDRVNFKVSSSINPTEVTVYEVPAGGGDPTYYLLKKSVQAIAGTVKSETFAFTTAAKFTKIALAADDVISILSVTDSDSNTWYEVPYLSQDTMFIDTPNTILYDQNLAQYSGDVPYLLRLKKTPRRFIKRLRSDNRTELHFGAGVSTDPDEILVPNPENVGSVLPGSPSSLDISFDPSNFLYTGTYGTVPANTTLTVTYTRGGGIGSNVNEGDLVNVSRVSYEQSESGLDSATLATAKRSLSVSNPTPARGGRGAETVDEIRHNALANFPTQNRAVTKEDYIARIYALPAKYGNVAKAYVVQDEQLSFREVKTVGTGDASVLQSNQELVRVPNPLAINAYVLGYDSSGNYTTLNQAVKENLKTYLSQYRMLTDAINIKDGFIVNLGVNFEVSSLTTYNKNEVVLKCIDRLKKYFANEKWQFNQPIIISEVMNELFAVEGVQSVNKLEFTNKWRTGDSYSGNIYDLDAATKDNIIYPSLDPSVFEIKFPNQDIKGRSR